MIAVYLILTKRPYGNKSPISMVLPIFPILLFYDYSLQRSDFNKTAFW